MQMSKEDEVFMNKVIEVINANMEDETFNVERMAEALCLSRSSLLRKNQDIVQHVSDRLHPADSP